MKPKSSIILLVALILTGVAFANADAIQQELSFLSITEKGELYTLGIGETKTIYTDSGRITTQLLAIDYNPSEISDVHIEEIRFSNENPQPGEPFFIEIPLTNEGSGVAQGVLEVKFDEQSSSASIINLQPGESSSLEMQKTFSEAGYYTLIAHAQVNNDIDLSDNLVCATIKIGEPEGTAVGGCGALGPAAIPKEAHIHYIEFNGRGRVINEQDLWLSPEDMGFPVELIKLGIDRTLAVIPR